MPIYDLSTDLLKRYGILDRLKADIKVDEKTDIRPEQTNYRYPMAFLLGPRISFTALMISGENSSIEPKALLGSMV